MTDLNAKHYRIQIELIETDFLNRFSHMEFYVFKGNPVIFSLIVGFRYTFFILSILTSIVYILHLLKIKSANRTIEHNLWAILGISLIFFNDPIFGLVLVNPTKTNIIISSLFVV